MKKRLLSLCITLAAAVAGAVAQAQVTIDNTNFPDENFRNFLLSQSYGEDAVLTDSEIQGITVLDLFYKGIKDLTGIEHFTALNGLYCAGNSLTTLDISKNTELTLLNCNNNSLTSLDVSKNTALSYLFCAGNSLTSLDVSQNMMLRELTCAGNQISGTDMTNLVNSLSFLTNGDLYVCDDRATTDNVITAAQVKIATDKGWTVKKSTPNGYVYLGVSINDTNFPDENFRNFLLAQSYGEDAVLTESEIQGITDLNMYNRGIKDLTGIEHFTALTYLSCSYNSLTSLDVTKNTALTRLYCFDNNLTSLNISANTALTELYCYNNSLTSLDVSNNTKLTKLECYNNSLTSLNVSQSTALTDLRCYKNSLTSLILSQNTGLTNLECNDNSLTSLDVSANTALTKLKCYNNSLTSLDVSQNTALTWLSCHYNNLESLDVSKNTKLTYLICYGNKIKGAAMTNLVNSLPSGTKGYLYLYVCDDKATTDNVITPTQVNIATGKGWMVKKYDSNGYEADYTGYPIAIDATNFPDENFRNYLLAKDYGKDGILTEEEMMAVTDMTVKGQNISSLTGIEFFTALTYLVCSFNSLTSLDVSWNKALKTLLCYSNSLTSLDVSQNTALEMLDCESNNLTSLDVSNNTALTKLYCTSNFLTSLDVSSNTALTYLACDDNNLTSLNVSQNKVLELLSCEFNNLESLDVSQNTVLTKLKCYGNRISGVAMTSLVNSLWSLPSGTEGAFYVCNDIFTPDNVITATQVKIATDKRWTVKKINNSYKAVDYAGQGDVNGDNKIDQDDLDLIVKIIMGQRPENVGEFAGDLNKDGRTDAADIVVMNNILEKQKGE